MSTLSFAHYSQELRRRLRSYQGGLVIVATIDSTQQLVRRFFEEYLREDTLPPPATVIAWHQSGGQGRQGRSWSSPAGQGSYVSLLRPIEKTENLQFLPLQVGVALCEALNRSLDGRCRLKWPNDLFVNGAKLGGLLVDLVGSTEKRFALIGFGVNHTGDPASFSTPTVITSLQDEGIEFDAPALVAELITSVDEELGKDPVQIVRRYSDLSLHRPGDVLRCEIGEERVEGRFSGFDDHGFLRLEIEGRERTLSTGRVFFAEETP